MRAASVGLLAFVLVGHSVSVAQPSAYFVSLTGSDENAGSVSAPFATIAHALGLVMPGDTVFVTGGVYPMGKTLRIEPSGVADSLIHIWAYDSAEVVLDFDGVDGEGIDLRGSFVYLRGLVVENASDNGIFVKRASNNIIERMTARYNRNSGVQVEDGSSDNLILNTDSYGNYDPQNNGENADGFAIKFDVGSGNVLIGCRAFNNSDDGFDFWEAGEGVTVEESWSFRNGVNIWNDPDFRGDSNGFKLGHGSGAHWLVRNLAWDHLAHGIDVNGNTTGVTVYNNTAFRNANKNFFFDEDNPAHVLRNNVSLGGDVEIYDAIDDSVNSWNGFNVGGADFVSLDDTGSDGPRQDDGSLPELPYLRPASGSMIIDAGMDVGIEFVGSAPDLGAYEATDTPTYTNRDLPDQENIDVRVYPNPVFRNATLEFTLDHASLVSVTVVDISGRVVERLADLRPEQSGARSITWYPSGRQAYANGLYFLNLEVDGVSHWHPIIYITE